MPEYIPKDQAVEIIRRNEYDWGRAVHEIQALPGADVAPVQRGKRLKGRGILSTCSACGCHGCGDTFRFCPHCGTKMMEETDR